MARKQDGTEDTVVEDYLDPEEAGLETKYVPEGWESAEAFLSAAIELYRDDELFDHDNRIWAMEDLRFLAGDQWDPEIKKMREDKFRPCLTINVLPQYVGQVVGNRRMNKTSIKIRPFKGGTQTIADVRSGIIKSIEAYSRAERAYDAACEDQTACGISALRVDLDYAGNDVFDQDIFIRHIPNPLAVIWDRMSVDPTGRDARHCFVIDSIPKKVYEKQFPDYPCPAGGLGDMTGYPADWRDPNNVRIVEFWELVDKPAKFALMQDGDVKDITGMAEADYINELWRDDNGFPRIRDSFRTYARMHLITGFAILGEAYEIPLTRLPIIRVEGRVTRVGEERVRFGIVRTSKDSIRLNNYFRSTAAEVVALAPKAQWIGSASAFKGREDDFRKAHLEGDNILIHNDVANGENKPQRVDPPAIPAALIQQSEQNIQDIKDTTGIHDASLGIRSNEVSGKAIEARRVGGDIATITYHDNVNHAIQEVGDVCNQLIPIAYDAVRMVRTIGDDDKHKLMVINDPNDVNSPNITEGKYDVSVETGPSFATQRQEAVDAMTMLIQTAPELMGVIGDIVAKNLDFPGAYEMAERIKRTIPKEILGEDAEESEEGGEPSQEEQLAQQLLQQQQQAQEEQMAMQQEMAQLELEEKRLANRKAAAEADTAEANADAAAAKVREAEARALQAETEADIAPALGAARVAQAKEAAKPRPAPTGSQPKPAAKPPARKAQPKKDKPNA